MGGRISQTSTSSADTKEVKSAKTQIIPVLGKHRLCLFCTKGPTWRATAPFIFRHHEESSNSQVFSAVFLRRTSLKAIEKLIKHAWIKNKMGRRWCWLQVLCINDITQLEKPLFESVVSIWAMSIREGRQGVNACLDGLEHFFSTSDWAISCSRGDQNACQDGFCTF